ncbi:MAG TPA: glycosyltransferase [Spirochaetota bacterium]|nr:glycosyltransferase [Spirochaetota bacterium]
MNIAYVCDQYWPVISGVSVSNDMFKKHLEKLGCKVWFFVPDYPGAAELDKTMGNRDVFRFKSYPLFFNRENRLVFKMEKKNLYKALDSIKPDIIHAHSEFAIAVMANKYARKNNIPFIYTTHTNWEELASLYVPFLSNLIGRLYARHRLSRTWNKADLLIAPTSLMEVLLQYYMVKVPIKVLPTGVDKSDFVSKTLNKKKARAIIIKRHPELKNKKILFFAGRIGMEKNIEFIINSLALLLPSMPDTRLIIAGDGPAKTDIMKYTADKGLSDKVTFTGFVARSSLKEYYYAADVFVFASKVESQGLVALEAMACGTPVVAIGKMGTREVMGGDNGGFMVDDDIDMFTEKVSLLLSDKKLHRIKTAEALRHVEKWTIETMAVKLLNIYKVLKVKKNAGR